MNTENFKNFHEYESDKKTSFAPPAIESFSDPASTAEVWPKEIADNEEFGSYAI